MSETQCENQIMTTGNRLDFQTDLGPRGCDPNSTFVFFVDFSFQNFVQKPGESSSLLRYNQVGLITQPALALCSNLLE